MVDNLKSRVFLILIVVGLAIGSMVYPYVRDGSSPFNLGLDLRGGVTLRYRFDKLTNMTPSKAEEQLQIIKRINQDRLDAIGVKEVSVRPVGSDQIEIAVPGIQADEAGGIRRIVESQGSLEFRLVAVSQGGVEIADERTRLDEEIERRRTASERLTVNSDLSSLTEGLRLETEGVSFRWRPISEKYLPDYGPSQGAVGDPEFWEHWELLRYETDEAKFFTGEDIDDVRPDRDPKTGLPAVGFTINPGKTASDFADFTGDNKGRSLVILLDGQVQQIATIQDRLPGSGVITGGSQGFTKEELQRLIAVIDSGSLPEKPVLESQTVVGPHLGEAAINRGMTAGLLALGLVLVFMLIYYRTAGGIACLALTVNFTVLMGALAFLDATLTLPGIAGLILTIGMAVDANILIFERIREELEKDKTLLQAVKAGFDRAFLTIVDANVTTFLTAFFLFKFGTGPIRGFAVILMIGLATSMFSALYFSKTLFAWKITEKSTKLKMLHVLSKTSVPFLGMRKKAFVLSAAVITGGLLLFFSLGRDKYGMDFTGGYEVQLMFQESATQQDILAEVRKDYDNAEVVTVGTTLDGKAEQFQIKVKSTTESKETGAEFARKLRERFSALLVTEAIGDLELAEVDPQGRMPANFDLNFVAEVNRTDVMRALDDNSIATISADPDGGGESGDLFHVTARFSYAETPDTARVKIADAMRGVAAADGVGTVRLSEAVSAESYIGPRAGVELRDAGIRAILASLIAIILYIRVRFSQYRFGLAACAALIHDVLVTIGCIALVRMLGLVDVELDLAIVAAFLTIIGYSLNDTIVIFDRIRENIPRSEGRPLPDILDRSINQTLSRTVLTSLTTLLSVAILFAFNLGQRNVLEGFAFALIVGVVVGTYSTIFVASPVVLWIATRSEAKAARARA